MKLSLEIIKNKIIDWYYSNIIEKNHNEIYFSPTKNDSLFYHKKEFDKELEEWLNIISIEYVAIRPDSDKLLYKVLLLDENYKVTHNLTYYWD